MPSGPLGRRDLLTSILSSAARLSGRQGLIRYNSRHSRQDTLGALERDESAKAPHLEILRTRLARRVANPTEAHSGGNAEPRGKGSHRRSAAQLQRTPPALQ